jgi:twitching motility protein PilI
MVMTQEYFTVEIGSKITLGLLLRDMDTLAQLETQNLCAVPGVEDFWYGVVNFRGSLLWVLDSDRFFNLELPRHKLPQKLTTLVIKNQQSDSEKQVALVVQQLKGIVAIEPDCCQSVGDDVSPQLRQCCSTVAQIEIEAESPTSQMIYLLDGSALLQQLHQQSRLVLT